MKEEEYREPLALGLIGRGRGGAGKKRYKLTEIVGFTDSFASNPAGTFGLGQLVFAQRSGCGCHGGPYTYMGECAAACLLIPAGISCYFHCSSHAWGICCSACTICGFSFGTGTYMALGSVSGGYGGGGATIWRRIV